MHLLKSLQLGTAAALFVAASVANTAAAPIVFTNEADFNAAVAAAGLTLGVESFEGQTSGPKPAALDMGAFTVTNPLPVNAITDGVGMASHGTKALVATPGLQPMTFTFDTAIKAFSIDVIDRFNTAGGSFLGSIGNGPQQTLFTGGAAGLGAIQFVGILDLDAAFTTLSFAGNGGIASFTLDRVQFAEGGDTTPVPEPTSLALLGAGLVAGARRPRARRP